MQINLIFESINFILPAWIVNISLNIFYAFFLKKGLAIWVRPLDMGKNFIDGRRIFGDGRTMSGFIISPTVGIIVGLIRQRIFDDCLIGVGAYLGSCFGSFIKRRLSIKRGDSLLILDQIDFIIGALILYSFLNPIKKYIIFYSMIFTLIFHPLFCFLGYKLNIKEKPW